MLARHGERHRTKHAGWLRAAVLGANDGILSTASLVLGVAAAHGSRGGSWKSQRLMEVAAAYWSQGLPVSSLGLCRWLRVNTCRYTRKQTPKQPIWRVSVRNTFKMCSVSSCAIRPSARVAP
jgi:hypothetical protein